MKGYHPEAQSAIRQIFKIPKQFPVTDKVVDAKIRVLFAVTEEFFKEHVTDEHDRILCEYVKEQVT